MTKLLLALSLLTATLPAFGRSVEDGWDNGNAGDTYTFEFIEAAGQALEGMKMLPQSELEGINLNLLAGVIRNTEVKSEEVVKLNEYEVDAKNYPLEGRIVMSRSRWRPLREASETKARLTLVLHEYLYMIGVNDDGGKFSRRIVPQLTVADKSPTRWWNPLNPVNRITMNLEFAPGNCSIGGLDLNLAEEEESHTIRTSGDCAEAFRSVVVTKNSFTAPPSSGARGNFHRYSIEVFDGLNQPKGTFTYEPEWGQCLLPQDGACRLSGKTFVGGVEFGFWLLR